MIAAALLGGLVVFAQTDGLTPVEEPPSLEEMDAATTRRVALLVGITDYDDPLSGRLRFTGRDAEDMETRLSEREGGFFETTTLTGRVELEQIESALEGLTADLGPGDVFLFYFSGHGTQELDTDGLPILYLLPSDGELAAPAQTAIAIEDLERRFARLASRRRVMIIDACHSPKNQPGTRSVLTEEAEAEIALRKGTPPAPAELEVQTSEVHLYAATYGQAAWENPKLENGTYTHYLLQALDGEGDTNDDGLIEVEEAHAWATAMTVEQTGNRQTPRATKNWNGAQRGDIYLSGAPSLLEEAEAQLQALWREGRLWVDDLLWEGDPKGIPPGPHDIRVETPMGIYVEQVDLAEGETLDITSITNPPTQTWSVALGGQWTPGAKEADITSNAALQVSAWTFPEGLQDARVGVGLSASSAMGTVWHGGPAAVGTYQVQGTWGVGQEMLFAGAALGVGALSRHYPDAEVVQVAALFSPGVHARLDAAPVTLTLDARVQMVPTSGSTLFYTLPSFTLSAGRTR